MQISLRLAELLSSRLCHDLVTPIGAINTGLELFQEAVPNVSKESEEILNLIQQSAQTASARASFFRVAFGSNGERVSLDEARQLIDNYFLRSKMVFEWKEPFQKDLTLVRWGRLLLNAVLWMSECAPRGGTLEISTPSQENLTLSLNLKASSIILHQGTLEAIEGKSSIEELTPRTISCFLIHFLIKENKWSYTLSNVQASSELKLEIKA
ncbi:MAG: hypothetical protein JSR85_05885 [Proteobacteria bacterium]|nr:hypothetical protein [Pseudomonadota bacterium]